LLKPGGNLLRLGGMLKREPAATLAPVMAPLGMKNDGEDVEEDVGPADDVVEGCRCEKGSRACFRSVEGELSNGLDRSC